MSTIRIALAQMNARVGDLKRNVKTILEFTREARALGADVVAFPELALTGYPPEDLLLKPSFLVKSREALDRIREETRGITVVVGFVDFREEIYNAAAVLHEGEVVAVHRKWFLPNYGVFDEDRYFHPGEEIGTVSLNGTTLGVSICEDLWFPDGPAQAQAILGGAEILLNLNASPYHARKWRFREHLVATRAVENACFVAYLNLVGGQDELVFDGHSLIMGPSGELLARGKSFEEDLIVLDLDPSLVRHERLVDPRRRKEKRNKGAFGKEIFRVSLKGSGNGGDQPGLSGRTVAPPSCEEEEVYRALVMGLSDYVKKNGFGRVVLGLSGGIDSSLVCAIAVDALGPSSVEGVFMPSPFSSKASLEDAMALAEKLGIGFRVIPIDQTFRQYKSMLSESFKGREEDVTEENIQARIRGNILMALSNKFGWMVLTTGNKSETACGYCTLYGDMAGGFAVIKDVPKTLVYQLSRYRNTVGRVIPERVLTRPPSAELREDQKDEDSLPPYNILDPILHLYIEEDRSLDEIEREGFPAEVVRKVIQLVDRNEYKRRQAPPGIKITPKAFGRDRRLPITNGFHEWE
ncbi:MAG: NAD+ synthase [Armatimonadetes bacterium]|nr:NAD+ synthase [Armatimonadota bacterium]